MAMRKFSLSLLRQRVVRKSKHVEQMCFNSSICNSTNFFRCKSNFALMSYDNFGNKYLFTQLRYTGSSSDKVEKDEMKKVNLEFPEQQITVYTCENLYKNWRETRKFWKVPDSGVYATLTYVDTKFKKNGPNNQITDSSPTVLCLHGSPGNYGIYNHLINNLSDNGIRVIAPTFPDVLHFPGKTNKPQLFRHSVGEKTQLFEDFLKALNISRLDAVVCHSSAVYPTLNLVLNTELKVKCQIFFNTGGHLATDSMKPYPIVWMCSHLYLYSWGRKFIQKTGMFIVEYILRSPLKIKDLHSIMLLALTVVFSEFKKAKKQFEEISKRQFPTLFCVSEDDKVVEAKIGYKVLQLMGATKQNASCYDGTGNLISKGKEIPWLKILSFEKGSHYVFRKHYDVCNKETLKIVKKCLEENLNIAKIESSSFVINQEKNGIKIEKDIENPNCEKCAEKVFAVQR